jgi:protein-S-isoprenylcysteine O-methyltransferase Ste14
MSRLELRIPPDAVWLALAVLMWPVSAFRPGFHVGPLARVLVALPLFVVAAALIASARLALARAGTTFSPVAPDRSSRLVVNGAYRFTRNPMYLGMLLALLALTAALASPLCLLLVAAFAALMDRLQIAPEERVLRARFGPAYEAYAGSVRRWL